MSLKSNLQIDSIKASSDPNMIDTSNTTDMVDMI